MEEPLILRVPPSVAEQLNRVLNEDPISPSDNSIDLSFLEDGRSGTSVIGKESFPLHFFIYPAWLSHTKLYDDNVLIKTVDIGQDMGMEQPAWQQQGMLGNEMERLMATMQAVEQACSSLQVPTNRASAEATLLAFRRSPHPVQACQYILEHSHVATARFQAAATMQEAAVREWTLLSAEDKNSLRTYCLHYVMARAEAGEAFVQAKVLAVAAVLLKRGWLDSVATEKESFFNEVRVAVQGRHGPAAQRSGIALLESLVRASTSPQGLQCFQKKCCGP